MRALGSETITILKPTVTTDSRDNTEILSFSPPAASIEVKGCNVQPFLISAVLQQEVTGERDYARATWRVWAPAEDEVLELDPHDRILFKGLEYELFGFPYPWSHLNGAVRHVQFVMQIRQG